MANGQVRGVNPNATGGSATQIAVNAGNNQSATVSSAVAIAPSVIVRDALNAPVSGVSVTFAVTGGGGSGAGLIQTTNAQGIATVGSWTLGANSGANTMTATATGLSGSPVTFIASAVTAGAVWSDGFESGTASTTPNVNGYRWGNNHSSNIVTPTTAKARTGSYGIPFTYLSKTYGEANEHNFRFGADVTEFWVEFYWFVPSNFYHRASGASGFPAGTVNNKLFIAWGAPGVSPFTDGYGSSSGTMIFLWEFEESVAYPSEGSSVLTCKAHNGAGEAVVYLATYDPFIRAGVNEGACTKNQWNQLRFYMKSSTAQGAANGQVKVWINGTRFTATGGNEGPRELWYGATYNSGTANPNFSASSAPVREGYFMGFSNSQYAVDTTFYGDDFSIYTTNPGW